MAFKQVRAETTPSAESIADIEPVVVRHIATELRNCGIDPELAFDGTGVRTEHLENEHFRISYGQTSHVVRRAMYLLDDRQLGLRLGSRVNLVSWGTAYVGLLACANSHEMLEFAAAFLPSGIGLLHLRCDYLPRGPSIVAHARFDEPDVAAFLVEKAFAAITHTCRSVLGSSFGPISVALTTARPTGSQAHAQAFACPVHFAQAENRIQFPEDAVTITSADALVLKKVRKTLLHQTASMVHSHELEISIVQALHDRFDVPPTLAEIATTMHLSERTLRRRLADLGLGYAELLDRERRRRALALLRSGQHTLHQVAIDTGFADVRSLRRAVKRWTGQSPTALKKHG